MALSFSCIRMRLSSHVNSAWRILCKFLAFNCAIFLNTNVVEIILPQSLSRFGAVVYGIIFMVSWMDSIIERIRSTDGKAWMHQIFGCQTDFSEFIIIIKPHWVKLFLTNFASSNAKFIEGEGTLRKRR